MPTPDSLLAREGSSDGRRVRRRLRGKANHNCFHLGCSHVTEAETSSLRPYRENVGPEAASLRRSGEGVGLEVASLGRSRENDGLAAESLCLSRENVGLEVASLGLSRENVGHAAASLRLSRENDGLEAVFGGILRGDVEVGVPSLAARRLDVGGSGGGWEPQPSVQVDDQEWQPAMPRMSAWQRRLEKFRTRKRARDAATAHEPSVAAGARPMPSSNSGTALTTVMG